MNKLHNIAVGLTAFASVLIGIENAPSALANSNPEIRIVEPLGIDGKLGYDRAITITFQLLGGWATSIQSCTEIRDQLHVPIIGLAAIDGNGDGINYEGLGGTIVHQAYYRRNFTGAPITNGFQCTGTFEWAYKPGDRMSMWGETGFSTPSDSLGWSTGATRSTQEIFMSFFDAHWGARDFDKGLGKIQRVSLAYGFVDKTTWVNISEPKRLDFIAVTESEIVSLRKAAEKLAAEKAASMIVKFRDAKNITTLNFTPNENKNGASTGKFTGKLSYKSNNKPVTSEAIEVCVSGRNPKTEVYVDKVCTSTTTDLKGYFSTDVELPPTYEVMFEARLKPNPNGFQLGDVFDGKDIWNNSKYLSQQTARIAADKKVAAAQATAKKKAAAAQAAADKKAASQAYQQAYSAVMNATVSNLRNLRFYNYLSPGGSMTNQNARNWCNSIRPFEMLWVAWIDGCAKAAQIQARR